MQLRKGRFCKYAYKKTHNFNFFFTCITRQIYHFIRSFVDGILSENNINIGFHVANCTISCFQNFKSPLIII